MDCKKQSFWTKLLDPYWQITLFKLYIAMLESKLLKTKILGSDITSQHHLHVFEGNFTPKTMQILKKSVYS